MVGEGLFRRLAQIGFGSGDASIGDFLFIPVALILLLVVLRLFSMAWAVMRLHGFTLTRTGEDLTFSSGLLTQRKGSIPLRRIQTVTLKENPWQRLAGRLSVRVETAGGVKEEDRAQRIPLVPILRREELPRLLAEIAPEVDLEAAAWEAVDPRGRRRAAKRALLFALPLGALLWPAGWWSLGVIVPAVLFLAFAARQEVALMRYASAPWGIAWRSGWLWRSLTLARHARLQVVTLQESPFDRPYGMASLAVDTAGAGGASHKIRIPYLARRIAESLQVHLTAEAAQTAFHW
jgi:putative membrane protein